MTLWDLFLWGAVPYIALTVFVLGVVWRYSSDPYGWTSKSSEVIEKRWLAWGSNLFHFGFLAVVVGHVMGLLVPASVVAATGMPDATYHSIALFGGGAAGVIAMAGLVILTVRRLAFRAVRATSTPSDYLTLALLLGVMSLGLYNTLGYPTLYGVYDYRDTVGAWVRGLLTLSPNVTVMSTTPVNFQVHALAGLAFFALFPFTRLVHILSLPFHYLVRRFIVFRTQRRSVPALETRTR